MYIIIRNNYLLVFRPFLMTQSNAKLKSKHITGLSLIVASVKPYDK
jgi:hypothetical protein